MTRTVSARACIELRCEGNYMHARLISLILIIIAAASFTACEKNTQSKKIETAAPVAALEEKDFELAGLKLGMTREQVEAVKGKPKSKEKLTSFTKPLNRTLK
jgi:outer membrane protein assembly factor BamE (lipoprotein component of BamABCDE complex)